MCPMQQVKAVVAMSKGAPVEVGEGELAEWEARGRHVYRALGDGPVEAVLVIRWARRR